MRGATVCSGIGSPEAAAPWIEWQWAAEVDSHACAVLSARHPSVRNLGDMTRITADEAEDVDVIVAGTPCQDFSIAGLRAGLTGERGNLTLEFVGLLERLRPRWFVLENVPGLLSMDEGRAFGAILGAMAELGYGTAYRVLDAQYAGVPQRRDRVIVVGYLGDWRPPAAVLLERESLRRDPAPSREAGQRAARPIAAGTRGSGGYRHDADTADNVIAGALQANDGGPDENDAADGRLVAGTIEAAAARSRGAGTSPGSLVAFGGNNTAGPIEVASACRAKGGTGHGDFESETFIAFDTTQVTNPDNRCNPQPGDPSHPLPAHGHPPAIAFDCKAGGKTSFTIGETPGTVRARTDGNLAVAFEPRFARNDRGAPSDIVNALKAQAGRTGKGDAAPCVAFSVESAVRRLTPRECERLQGFPDDFTLVPYRGKPMADGPRYRMLGNAMAVPVMAWVLERLGLIDGFLRAARGEY